MKDKYVIHIKGESVEKKLKETGRWIVASIEQSIGWPTENIIIIYENVELFLLGYQSDTDVYPGVAIKLSGQISESQAKEIIPRFLSCVNWSQGGFVRIKYWGGGSLPFRMSGVVGKHLTNHFRLSYIPSNLSPDAYLALALFREGNSLRLIHPGYSFLSYYKVINLIKKNGEKQKKWITQNLDNVSLDGKKRIEELQNEGVNISEYLYHSCRCALAHAGTNPTVNPDDAEDNTRFYKDLPLIKDLAHEVIRTNFSVPTSQDIYKMHLYELDGFKEYIPNEMLEKIQSGERLSMEIKGWNKISIRQWLDKKYGVFENLSIVYIQSQDKKVILKCTSEDNFFSISIVMDFQQERFDIDTDNIFIDKNANEKAFDYAINANEYIRDLVLNGSVEVWDCIDNKPLGRKDPNIPVNIDLGRTVDNFNRNIEVLKQQKKNIETR